MDGKTFRHLFEPETRRLDQNIIKGIKETSFRGLTAESYYDNLFKEAITNVNGSINAMASDGQVSYPELFEEDFLDAHKVILDKARDFYHEK